MWGLGFLCPRIDSCDEISCSLCKIAWCDKNRLLVWDEILMLTVVFLLKTISTKLVHSKFMTVNGYPSILSEFRNNSFGVYEFWWSFPPTPTSRKCSVVAVPHNTTPDFPLSHPSQIIAFLWICLHYINLFRKPWHQKIFPSDKFCVCKFVCKSEFCNDVIKVMNLMNSKPPLFFSCLKQIGIMLLYQNALTFQRALHLVYYLK